MIISCPSCQTRFRLAPDRLGPTGARIRCSACKAVFRLAPSGEVSPDGPAAPVPGPSGNGPAPGTATPSAAPGGGAGADPFEPRAAARPAASADPFASPGRAPVAADPFAADLGPDPFSLGAAVAAPPSPVRRAAEALQATVAARAAEPAAPPAQSIDPDALSLEEASTPPRPHAGPPPLPARTPEPSPSFALADDATRLVEGRRDEPGSGSAAPPLAGVDLLPDVPAVPSAAPVPEPTPVPVATEAEGGAAGHTATAALPRLRRRTGAAALAANSLSLALLLALTAGLLSWRGDLPRRVRAAMGGAAGSVEPSGVRAGLYDTSAGPAVLVVRGEVRARRGAPGPVRVRVELVDGSRTVAAAEALAGAAATPEEVFAASTSEEVASLRRALDERAVKALPPGGAAPFLVLFPAPVPELAGLEVRTAVEGAPGR